MSNNNTNELCNTLFHEMIHIIQRKNQSSFDKFYTNNWNFKKIRLHLNNNKWIQNYKITNPDINESEFANQEYWIYPISNHKYKWILPVRL